MERLADAQKLLWVQPIVLLTSARPSKLAGTRHPGYRWQATATKGEDRYIIAVAVVEIAAMPAGLLLNGSRVK